MTSLTEILPVDEITEQARQVHMGRTLLTVIAAVFFCLGWTASRAFFAMAWCAVAVRVGWQAGRRPGQVTGGPSRPG